MMSMKMRKMRRKCLPTAAVDYMIVPPVENSMTPWSRAGTFPEARPVDM